MPGLILEIKGSSDMIAATEIKRILCKKSICSGNGKISSVFSDWGKRKSFDI
jgi:hypothetical protein